MGLLPRRRSKPTQLAQSGGGFRTSIPSGRPPEMYSGTVIEPEEGAKLRVSSAADVDPAVAKGYIPGAAGSNAGQAGRATP
ncbi:MAG: hypothetical protein ABR520_02395 [Mycobacteriales bacterium]|nr:hypothetical protein [Frankia sp.]